MLRSSRICTAAPFLARQQALTHAEPVLFINDSQPQIVKFHPFAEQGVRADDQLRLSPLASLSRISWRCLLFLRPAAAQSSPSGSAAPESWHDAGAPEFRSGPAARPGCHSTIPAWPEGPPASCGADIPCSSRSILSRRALIGSDFINHRCWAPVSGQEQRRRSAGLANAGHQQIGSPDHRACQKRTNRTPKDVISQQLIA